MLLIKNMLIEWHGEGGEKRVERILYIDPITQQMSTICVTNLRELWVVQECAQVVAAVIEGKARVLDEDPYIRLDKPEHELSTIDLELRDKAWAAIRHLFENGASDIFDPRQRGRLIADAAKRATTTKMVIYKYIRRYLQGGMRKNALLPHFYACGAPGKEKPCGERKRGRPSKLSQDENQIIGINVDAQVREKFRRGYEKHYLKADEPNFKLAFQRTLEDFFRTEWVLEKGVLVQKLPPRENRPTFNAKYRPLIGNTSKLAIGPGYLYMIDATPTDYYLVNSLDPRRLLGRAVFYKVVDVLTWTIVGVDVGLHNPSWLGAMLAIYNATRNKVEFCAEHGIEITWDEWPVNFLSEGLLADRGELKSDNADNLAGALDLPVFNTPPYRGDLKYLVEQEFHRTHQRLRNFIPSAFNATRKRGDRDPRLDACLTPREARQISILDALDHNKNFHLSVKWLDEFMIQDQVERYPLDLWNWGITHRAGHLRTMPADLIRANLLPQGTARVTGHGIQFKGMSYTCSTAEAEDWFVKARVRGSWELPIVFDPRLPETIYLRLDNGRRMERCQRLDRDDKFAGRDLEEIEDFVDGQQVLDQAAVYRRQDTDAEPGE